MSPLGRARWRRFRSRPTAVVSSILLLVILLLAALAPVIASDRPLLVRYEGSWFFPQLRAYPETDFGGFIPLNTDFRDPFIQQEIKAKGWILWSPIPFHYNRADDALPSEAPTPPDARHWLGTDDAGRDVLSRLLHGIRISLLFGLIYSLVTASLGIAAGAAMGYLGGAVDLGFQRLLEIFNSLPQFFILLSLVAIFRPSFTAILLVLIAFGWTGMIGAVRAEVLRGRQLDYVMAARALGVPQARIVRRHILPNAFIAPMTLLPFAIAGSVTILSQLDYLGFGLPVNLPSLGEMVVQAQRNYAHAPHLVWAIFGGFGLLTTLIVFVGEGVRDALDPRKSLASITLEDVQRAAAGQAATLEAAPQQTAEDAQTRSGESEAGSRA